MKIGILTLPFNNNYGGFLQAYALMTVLKRMGHDVWFIDLQLRFRPTIIRYHLLFFKQLIKKYLLRKDVVLSINKEYRQNELNTIITWQYTRPFVDKYLCPKLSPIYSSEELTYLIKNISFDAFIAGSDQIWRPQCMKYFLKTAFFDFLKSGDAKSIIYAASFGTDKWEYSSNLTKECAELVKKINAISVREKLGVSLCKKHFGIEAQQVLDPTLLLDKNDYVQLIDNAGIKQNSDDLFCYVLDKTKEKEYLINNVASQLGLNPFFIGIKNDEKNVPDSVLFSVETWLQGFNDAKFVITDSFHGMVFSIIFNKPFLCIINERRGVVRFTSLAQQLGLMDRLIFSVDNKFSIKIDENIDWNHVNMQMKKEKYMSMNYLLEGLR